MWLVKNRVRLALQVNKVRPERQGHVELPVPEEVRVPEATLALVVLPEMRARGVAGGTRDRPDRPERRAPAAPPDPEGQPVRGDSRAMQATDWFMPQNGSSRKLKT